MKTNRKMALVILSGGMDSAICLAQAIKDFGADQVAALTFDYGQRHANEQQAAKKIAAHFQVDHRIIELPFFSQLTNNALLNHEQVISRENGKPNTLVTGRNGLFARLGAIYGQNLGVQHLYLGVMELEVANSGYLDCSRKYFDLMEEILRLDLNTDSFWIHTPLVSMSKAESLELAYSLGELKFILENTVTCYEGIPEFGCAKCFACHLRNSGIQHFLKTKADFQFSYRNKF